MIGLSGNGLIQHFSVPALHNDDVIAFSDVNPNIAIINLSSMNPGKFERWRWFHENPLVDRRALYIFLKDDNQHYYIGTEENPTFDRYTKIISVLLNQYGVTADRAISIGSSMGGYGSLLFAFRLGFAASICVNPQVDLRSAELHDLRLWARKIKETGSLWEDLDTVVARSAFDPVVYLRTSEYVADVSAAKRLDAALRERSSIVIRKYDRVHKHGWFGPSSNSINSVISSLLSLAVDRDSPLVGVADLQT